MAARDAVTITLDDGRSVRLADLLAPPSEAEAAAMTRYLSALSGATLRLYPGAGPDRYGRLVAQVVTAGEGRWLQADLVKNGLAAVAADAMSDACVSALITLEERAAAARGTTTATARDPAALMDRIGAFAVVEGTVLTVGRSRRNVFLNFGADWSTDLTAIVARRDMETWPAAANGLDALAGRRVRLRGYVERWNGPLIRIEHPAQIRVLPD